MVILAIVAFALVNAVLEEALYRGVLQSELTVTLGVVPAVLIQAVGHGLAHAHGYPSGWAGAVMAGSWAVVLGVLRHRTKGILAPYLAHVCADAAIGILAVTLLRS
ncbi:CPBP family intramembrane metalloprotease [Pseudonocardiaceae bacterium YIM PH 21723]|nr:CPBP family intramembrane metalloprotease [Pseudonocardiaceae bacterium YIM PH 21723]